MTSRLRALLGACAFASLAATPLAAQRGTAVAVPAPTSAAIRYDRTGVGDTSVFAPLALRAPNEIRTGSGAPGAKYWQNHADYDIRATLDTGAKTVTGTLRLRYTNNSPDTLHYIWMQVEQNAFRDKSLNSYIFPQDSRFGARGFEGGDVVTQFDQVLGRANRHVALKTRPNETEMKVDLAEPLAPRQTATFDVAWHFLVPEHGADRMGREGMLYELAQWYPRVNVYDDLRGWNTEPYLGQGEFYLEYGNYTVELTVPAGYTVASTGSLTNPREVLTPTVMRRLAEAATSATPVHVITLDEIRSGAAHLSATGTKTWRFSAKNVRDVAWAASPEYLWDASSWKGILAQSFYRPSAVEPWKDAADQTRMSLEEYSTRWFQYPWPQMSAVEGPISGMEYPMLVMEAKSEDKYDLYNVVTHEIGHNWFPMIVGSNERVYMWQDEGFNTFINTFSEARRYPEKGDQLARGLHERQEIEAAMVAGADIPLNVMPDRVEPRRLGLSQYVKPSVGLQFLRQEIMGPAAFDDAFRTYIERWAYKHPSPADFYRTMEDVGGKRLDWFWREWFEENPRFDQAIDTVVTQKEGAVQTVGVAYGNRARGVLPIHARFTFSDGSTQTYDYPAEVWSTNTTRYLRQYSFTGKTLSRIELDPDKRVIDIDRTNNVWTAPN